MGSAQVQSAEAQDREIFGSFHLVESEFAVSVSHVQEVVNAPRDYTAVPLAPRYLKGLYNLRGTIIPVLDLRDLLNLTGEKSVDSQKIAVIEFDGACVGLLFDKTGEVFKNNSEERSDFERTDAASVVCGVFKKDSGRRIIQILDVTRLFKLKNVPKETGRTRLGHDLFGRKRGNRKQCISFVVGPAKCALPISDIQEILKIDRVNESALGGGDCIGTIDLRGITVPVIDFASLLKYRDVDQSEGATQGDRRVIVMRLEKELFGLMVDSIDSIVSFFPDELVRFPVVEQNKADMFLGCITGHGEGDILLLDYQKILSDSEVNQITRGHSKLYRTEENTKAKIASKGGVRKTYITFKIVNPYAVAINEVKEIIDVPQELLQPPGLQDHVRGVLNLRGDLVTIFDARAMYQKSQEGGAPPAPKVLVLKKNEVHFGLIVDTVDAILTFAENDKIKLPEMLYRHSENKISGDISEAVEVVDNTGQKRNLLILSVEALAERALGSAA